MKNLGIRNITLLSEGANITGSFKEAYFYIEESLYVKEARTIYNFCVWVDEKIGGGSSHNLEILFQVFINPNDEVKVKAANAIKNKIDEIKGMLG
jgi:hypothetical protein